jgi:aspartate-semialdehyde dehydrogenase
VRGADALDAVDATGGDLAFVALDDEYSARYVPRLRQLGYRVIDKSNTYRHDPAVPLVVAGVNDGLVTARRAWWPIRTARRSRWRWCSRRCAGASACSR